jgi:hypothetical protein
LDEVEDVAPAQEMQIAAAGVAGMADFAGCFQSFANALCSGADCRTTSLNQISCLVYLVRGARFPQSVCFV